LKFESKENSMRKVLMALLAAFLVPSALMAQQPQGVHSFRIGGSEVIALQDGWLNLDPRNGSG
jgi:hypothetical protein